MDGVHCAAPRTRDREPHKRRATRGRTTGYARASAHSEVVLCSGDVGDSRLRNERARVRRARGSERDERDHRSCQSRVTCRCCARARVTQRHIGATFIGTSPATRDGGLWCAGTACERCASDNKTQNARALRCTTLRRARRDSKRAAYMCTTAAQRAVTRVQRATSAKERHTIVRVSTGARTPALVKLNKRSTQPHPQSKTNTQCDRTRKQRHLTEPVLEAGAGRPTRPQSVK